MRILFLGDICAKPGREAVVGLARGLRAEMRLDFIIANAENAAAGYGIAPAMAEELLKSGVDCLTTGDHFMDRKEIAGLLDQEPRLLRPLNYADGVPGVGSGLFDVGGVRVAVINLVARTFMKATDSPFQRIVPEVRRRSEQTKVIIVDFHGEATAEKICMGWYLDGQVSAVLGTHTHVATADERILPKGTAYITDVGMCGAMDSVLGMRVDLAVKRMMLSVPLRLEPSRENIRLGGVVLDIDPETGHAQSIERVSIPWHPPANPPAAAESPKS